MVKEIICKHGEIALVDDEDYQVLSYHKWHFTGHDNRPYVCTKLNNCEGNTRNIYMHNFLVSIAVNVDHKDGNTLNNQKDNLRVSTKEENEWNKPKQKTSKGKPCTSQYKGVSLCNGRWRAQIKRNGVHYPLGEFANEEDAARAYNKKCAELSGDFVWLNPLPELTNKPDQKGGE